MKENQKGKAAAFATFSPFKSRWSHVVQWVVHAGALKHARTIRRLAFLHHAYWLTVRRKYLDRAGVPGERSPKHGGLLFVSAFNGGSGEYVKGFSDVLAKEMNALWSQSEQWEAAENLPELNHFINRHRRDAHLFFNFYGDNEATRVRTALVLRKRLESIAAEHAGRASDGVALARQVNELVRFLYGGMN